MRLFMTTLLVVSLFWLQPTKDEVLTNTNWSGILHAPDPVDAVLEFKTDSMFVYIGPELIETMTYAVKGDTLTLTKVSGSSPCDQQPVNYQYSVKDENLKLLALTDNCTERKNAFAPEGYKRMK